MLVVIGGKQFIVTAFTIRWFCVQTLTSVENVHSTHLQFATWGMWGCWCWKVFKLNTQRGERNPDELITLSENTHKCSWPPFNQHTCRDTRAEAATAPDTHSLCPAPLSLKTFSFQQALIFPLRPSLASLCFLSVSVPLLATIQKSKMWKTRSPTNTDLISWFN